MRRLGGRGVNWGGGGGGGGGQYKTGERTHMERTCGGKLFPHFVLSSSNTRDLHRDGGKERIFSLRIIPFVT